LRIHAVAMHQGLRQGVGQQVFKGRLDSGLGIRFAPPRLSPWTSRGHGRDGLDRTWID
jgi:hypothetical protein